MTKITEAEYVLGERAGILEFQGLMSRENAEARALREMGLKSTPRGFHGGFTGTQSKSTTAGPKTNRTPTQGKYAGVKW